MITFFHFILLNAALTQQMSALDYMKKTGNEMALATEMYSRYTVKQFDAEGNLLKQEEAEVAFNVGKNEYYSRTGNDYVIENKNEQIHINAHTRQIIISNQYRKSNPKPVMPDYSLLDSMVQKKQLSVSIETETESMVRLLLAYPAPSIVEKMQIDIDKSTFMIMRMENHYRKAKHIRAVREEYVYHAMSTSIAPKKDFFSLKNYAIKQNGKMVPVSAFSQYTVIDQRK